MDDIDQSGLIWASCRSRHTVNTPQTHSDAAATRIWVMVTGLSNGHACASIWDARAACLDEYDRLGLIWASCRSRHTASMPQTHLGSVATRIWVMATGLSNIHAMCLNLPGAARAVRMEEYDLSGLIWASCRSRHTVSMPQSHTGSVATRIWVMVTGLSNNHACP
jgi:hypothetical protein